MQIMVKAVADRYDREAFYSSVSTAGFDSETVQGFMLEWAYDISSAVTEG
ncbi:MULTISPECIES: hypothetical protein [Escherichia]|nr:MULTISPECIES: hypothetical protein [Escherichia]MCO4916687.1 hypothetical protein [Escherichia coli]MCY6462479.1 hypothetical protein [Escherichia coli]MCY6646331.1 hypothetical protein [Escherichia coli]MDW9276302.1 hypothetical protein [Escherichia coli]WGB18739.1 hypothetical protein NFL29_13495 [Escherichia coli]